MGKHTGEVAAHFARRAAGYAQHDNWVNDAEALAPIISALQQKPDGTALEIGAGTGAVARARRPYPANGGRLIGVDVTHSMLLQHARHAPAVVGDAHCLPFARGCADIIICRQSVHYFDLPDMVFAEVKRVLASDGRLLIAQIVPFEDPQDEQWWKRAVTLRQPLRRHRWTAAELSESLRGVGFTIESTQELRRRTSLKGWLERYALDPANRQELLDHFRSTPSPVRRLREFAGTGDAVEYSLRWVFITSVPEKPAGD